MNRRRYLGALVGGTLGALAGCASLRNLRLPADADRSGAETRDGASTGTPSATNPSVSQVGDVTLPVPTTDMRSAVPRDYIPAIVDPAFAEDWSGLTLPEDSRGESTTLPDGEAVIGVTRDGEARAYPLRILNWHEVVNDDFGGPLLVTYCVICGSSVVVERRVDGDPTVFGVSGYLWRRDLVLYDRATDSLWSQLLATALNGPATGDRLPFVPSTLTTWGEWRREHPETKVLLPPPASTAVEGWERTFDYFTPKYDYDNEAQLIGYDSYEADPHSQTLVVGVEHDGHARAYTFDAVAEAGVVNDTVAGLPVAVAVVPGGTLVAYDRRIDGDVLEFSTVPGEEALFEAGGSRWQRSTGEAVDGPYAGRRLVQANELPPMFWTGWVNFHPDSSLYTRDGVTQPES